METKGKNYTLQSQYKGSSNVTGALETINMSRHLMPDGSLKFEVNGRDFSNVGASEKVRIVSESATFTITPRAPFFVDKENAQDTPATIDNSHMDVYFNLVEEAYRWFDVLEENGTLQSSLIEWNEFGVGEMDVMNFRAFANGDVSSTMVVEGALTDAVMERIERFNRTNSQRNSTDQKTFDRLSTFRPYVEAVAGEKFLTFQPL